MSMFDDDFEFVPDWDDTTDQKSFADPAKVNRLEQLRREAARQDQLLQQCLQEHRRRLMMPEYEPFPRPLGFRGVGSVDFSDSDIEDDGDENPRGKGKNQSDSAPLTKQQRKAADEPTGQKSLKLHAKEIHALKQLREKHQAEASRLQRMLTLQQKQDRGQSLSAQQRNWLQQQTLSQQRQHSFSTTILSDPNFAAAAQTPQRLRFEHICRLEADGELVSVEDRLFKVRFVISEAARLMREKRKARKAVSKGKQKKEKKGKKQSKKAKKAKKAAKNQKKNAAAAAAAAAGKKKRKSAPKKGNKKAKKAGANKNKKK